jgi:CBS domain-containing protein
MLPIADLARLHTLARAGTELGTVERLQGAREAGQLSADLAGELAAGYDLALTLRLRAQLEALRSAGPLSNRLAPSVLAPHERSGLRDALVAIRTAQSALDAAYVTALLG